MKIGLLTSGFRAEAAYESGELGGTLWQLRHEKTGAPLYWLDNGEENKVFCAAFRTVPSDDTGVFHILEHSVLCGSAGYPVKEPFLDLMKSSMNTFLNAFTFPDKTMYPVASRNERDFLNLTAVYLDAVFRPLLTENPGIFLQEGARIDFDQETPSFNGVVYNEMKGASSSLSSQIYRETERLLFPDTCYGFVSGGDPAAIPTLTYETFLETYRTFYHPSNGIFYLDGSVPVDPVLSLIDGYLQAFEKQTVEVSVTAQPPIASVRAERSYEIGENEPAEKKTCIVFGRHAGDFSDRKRLMALEVLRSYLFGTNEAPIKRAVLESGLAEDVTFSVIDGMLQPFTLLLLRNTEKEHRDRLAEILRAAAEAVLAEGLPAEFISAELDRLQLAYHIPEEPQGVWRAVEMLSSVLYGGEPLAYLEHDGVISALRAEIGGGYFEDLIRAFFLEKAHTAEVILTPDPLLGKKRAQAEQALLRRTLAAMTPGRRAEAEARFAAFKAWQDAPDPPAAKAALPRLSVSDLAPSPAPFITETEKQDGAEVLFHPRRAKGVTYMQLYFNACDLPPEDLPALSFLTGLFMQLPTSRHSVRELQRELKRLTGNCHADTLILPGESPERAKLWLTMEYSALSEKLPQAAALAAEILVSTDFSDPGRVREILTQRTDRLYRAICASGSRYAGVRALAAGNAHYAAVDLAEGLGFYRWLKAFSADFDRRIGPFFAFAEKIIRSLCVAARLTTSQTADTFSPAAFDQVRAFPAGEKPREGTLQIPAAQPERQEAFIIPGGVSFAALGADLRRLGTRYAGGMNVLSSMLTLGYLWNEIRVRGGAYGCGASLSSEETLRFTSYRDPSPMRSLSVYRAAASFLETQIADRTEVEQYIVSTVAETDPLRSPADWGKAADRLLLRGRTRADREREYKEMLGATAENLRAFAGVLVRAAAQGAVCVIGSREALTAPDSPFASEEIEDL